MKIHLYIAAALGLMGMAGSVSADTVLMPVFGGNLQAFDTDDFAIDASAAAGSVTNPLNAVGHELSSWTRIGNDDPAKGGTLKLTFTENLYNRPGADLYIWDVGEMAESAQVMLTISFGPLWGEFTPIDTAARITLTDPIYLEDQPINLFAVDFGADFGLPEGSLGTNTIYLSRLVGEGTPDIAAVAAVAPVPAAAWAGMTLLGAMGGCAGLKRKLRRA